MDKYLVHEGKKLRYGYTTGVCAAAASKAAVYTLISGNIVENIDVTVGSIDTITVNVYLAEKGSDYCSYYVIKDSGDDPDITDGIKIYGKVSIGNEKTIVITGGIGVGKVTKKGLAMGIGEYAINPKPREMIESEIRKIDGENGYVVEISAPEGVEIAKKTLNPKLGIEGGISILGTTGILKPMSEEAFKDSLAVELKVMLAETGKEEIYFSFGNYGMDFGERVLGINKKEILSISNFVGYMLEKASEFGVKKINFIGNIGKMVKVAGGIFHTHSKYADCRLEILASAAIVCNEKNENILKILHANTTEEAIDYITKSEVYEYVANKAAVKCGEYLKRYANEVEIGVLIFSNEKGELARTKNFMKGAT